MAITKTKIRFSIPLKTWGEQIHDEVVEEQTSRLIAYAMETVQQIGDKMRMFDSKNNLDRTGNLLRSLCWGVSFDGKMKASGFYEGAGGSKGISYLHEFSGNDAISVDGRKLADDYIEAQKGKGNSKGWRMFVAVLAPYWGYWEEGFTMKIGGHEVYGDDTRRATQTIPYSTRYFRYNVMAQTWDVVRKDLKPAKTNITVYVPKYIHKSEKWRRKLSYKGKNGKLRPKAGVYVFGKQR